MTKTKYPFFNEKGSIHLMKTMYKDGLVYLSEGKIDLFIDTDIEIWDSAAGVLICKESGVMITDQKGDDNIFESKSIVGAKDWLHQKIIKKLTY